MSSLEFSRKIRRLILEMVFRAKASHIGSSLSIADIVAVLYSDILNIKVNHWDERDRFILSKGHACTAIYAALHGLKFLNDNDIINYGKFDSLLMHHISHKIPAVEFSTGSLGHGLPFAIGKALAAKKQNSQWKSYVLMSDGEQNEGSNWEGYMFASHHGLDNLVAIIDYNKLQSLTSTSETLEIEPLTDKLEAFGWSVKIGDGHDHAYLSNTLSKVPWIKGKPSILIANTVKGKGVDFMENKVEWHYKSPNRDEYESALSQLESV